MQPSLEKLRKFFRLEHENGYNDTAVIGGLGKVVDPWSNEARLEGVPEDIVQLVATTLRAYAEQRPPERAAALKALWQQIRARIPETAGAEETLKRPARRAPSTTPAVPDRDGAGEVARSETVAPVPEPTPPLSRAPEVQPHGAPRASRPTSPRVGQPVALNASLQVLTGVGPRHAAMLARLGLNTLGDMLYHFPRRYEDYSRLKPIHRLWYGEEVTVVGTIQLLESRKIRGGTATLIEAVIHDGTGSLRLTWFNQPWLVNRMKVGDAISVSGKVEQYLGRLVMNNPDWEPVEVENLHTNRIVPIYPLTANVTQKWLRRLMYQVVTYWAPKLSDHLPETIRREVSLLELGEALRQVHFPDSQEKLQEGRRRLAFDEIFLLQMGVLRQKRDWQAAAARRFLVRDPWLQERLAALPYALTNAQRRALEEIWKDFASGRPMNRLLQGDVGSGKTVVAALAAALVTRAGAQAAIMAPTSLLAGQHYQTFCTLLTERDRALLPEQIRLLVGDTSEKEKEEIRAGLVSGAIKIVIGTHALLEEPVTFADLQFVVIDEQHRFGVAQRAALRAKGANPHLLVMTATPIPRSLALTIYGDLDLSVMDEMPAGRQPVATYVLMPRERERAYTLIRGQVAAGRQAFIVYPLIEESENLEVAAAVDEHARLQRDIFPDLKLGLLHGRMRPEEKDEVMARFRAGEYHILVTTTVIEVGVDIPNATVMLIEGADRFGLAQLHQLRGRVGRGAAQAYCLLIPSREDEVENERLAAMVETNDGFVLAERDLQQRGPGEFLGTRQAGFVSSLRMASLSDVALIEQARVQAQRLFEQDPDLQAPEHALLAEAVSRFWGGGKGDVS